jgi:hypothetical protein
LENIKPATSFLFLCAKEGNNEQHSGFAFAIMPFLPTVGKCAERRLQAYLSDISTQNPISPGPTIITRITEFKSIKKIYEHYFRYLILTDIPPRPERKAAPARYCYNYLYKSYSYIFLRVIFAKRPPAAT